MAPNGRDSPQFDQGGEQTGRSPERRGKGLEFTTKTVTEVLAASHRHKPALTSVSSLPGLRAVIIYLGKISHLGIG